MPGSNSDNKLCEGGRYFPQKDGISILNCIHSRIKNNYVIEIQGEQTVNNNYRNSDNKLCEREHTLPHIETIVRYKYTYSLMFTNKKQ